LRVGYGFERRLARNVVAQVPKISCRRCKQSVKTPDSKPSSCTLKNMFTGRRARYVPVLGLHKPKPLKILAGAVAGIFVAVAKPLGHDAIDADRAGKEIYDDFV